MGIYGSTLAYVGTSKSDFNTSYTVFDLSSHAFYNGIDWVYTYVETLYMYDYKVLYF